MSIRNLYSFMLIFFIKHDKLCVLKPYHKFVQIECHSIIARLGTLYISIIISNMLKLRF